MSSYEKPPIDPREDEWIGRNSSSEKIRTTEFWSVNHVGEQYDSVCLSRFENYTEEASPL